MKRIYLLLVLVLNQSCVFSMSPQRNKGFKVAQPSAAAKKAKTTAPKVSTAQTEAKAVKASQQAAGKTAREREILSKYENVKNLSTTWPQFSKEMNADVQSIANGNASILASLNTLQKEGDRIYQTIQNLKNKKVTVRDANTIFQDSSNNLVVFTTDPNAPDIAETLISNLRYTLANWANANVKKQTESAQPQPKPQQKLPSSWDSRRASLPKTKK